MARRSRSACAAARSWSTEPPSQRPTWRPRTAPFMSSTRCSSPNEYPRAARRGQSRRAALELLAMETSEFASRLNRYVYDAVVTWRRTDADGGQTPVVFRCECGCNRPVWRTIEEYDAAGG